MLRKRNNFDLRGLLCGKGGSYNQFFWSFDPDSPKKDSCTQIHLSLEWNFLSIHGFVCSGGSYAEQRNPLFSEIRRIFLVELVEAP